MTSAIRIGIVTVSDRASRGEYQDRSAPPYVMGQEFSGDVLDAPAGSGFAAGDRVAGMTSGAAAERLLVDPASLVRLPDAITHEQGAGAIFNYQTAIVALEIRGRLKAGETVLAHGAGGGTGTAVVQVAKALGARVIGVVSSDEKAEAAKHLKEAKTRGEAVTDLVWALVNTREFILNH